MAPTVARPFNYARASAASAIAFFMTGPAFIAAGGAMGLVLGGPAAIAAGAAQGLAFTSVAHLGPLIGSLAYVVFGTGTSQCMCSPRKCIYDAQTEGCVMSASDAPSSNPYGRSLPFMSQKCVPNHAQMRCELQTCDVSDFTPNLGIVNGVTLYGKVGRQANNGIYNCMSSSGLVDHS